MAKVMTTRPQMFLQARKTDKNIFLDGLHFFDGFQVWATMPTPMVNFVRDVGKPFFVDPMSYIFPLPTKQLMDKEESKLRPAVTRLATTYSDLIASTLSQRSITSQDILSQLSTLEELVEKCLDYQRTKFDTTEPSLFNANYDKYDRLAGEGFDVPHTNNTLAPFTLIPPYFHFQDVGDPWYTATLRCARIAKKFIRSGESLTPVLLLSKRCLNPVALTQILKDFGGTNADGFILWVNGMLEEDARPTDIANLTTLVSGLSQKGRKVYKLYGGFLSVLLHDHGLAGFSTSVTTKTAHSIRSYGGYGKAPKPKFYIQRLHRSYPLEEAAQIIRAHRFLACDCRICQQAYGKNLERIDSMATPGYCENHFLNVRKDEIDAVHTHGTQPLFDEMEDTLRRLGSDASEAIHLAYWRTALAGASSNPAMISPSGLGDSMAAHFAMPQQ